MTAIREAELPAALKRGGAALRGVLVYGGDEVRVAGVVEQVVKAIAAPEDVTRLTAAALRGDAALLDEALRSQSFLGGRQLVLVSEVTDVQAKLIEPALQIPGAPNFLVLAAGSSASPRRSAVSARKQATFSACRSTRTARPTFSISWLMRLAAAGLRLSEEASERFMALCGTDRALALNEAEKLSLYALGQTEISEEDVIACCGDQASFGLDGAIDAMLGGDSLAADRMLHAFDDSDWKAVLPNPLSHVARLSNLRMEVDRQGGIEAALRTAKPPSFSAGSRPSRSSSAPSTAMRCCGCKRPWKRPSRNRAAIPTSPTASSAVCSSRLPPRHAGAFAADHP